MDPHEWAGELAQSKVLHDISTQLINEDNAEELYQRLVDAASMLMRSDFASMQMYCPEKGTAGLQLLAFRGFRPEAARFWEWVRIDSGSSCAEALRRHSRIIVPDAERCDFMCGSDDLAMYRHTGIRAVQTTPLISRDGSLVGMISTHWSEPHEPAEQELRFFDILARQAADLIERRRAHDDLEAQITDRTAEIANTHQSLRELSMRLMQAQDKERRRVARELHDSAGQIVLSIGCALEEAYRNGHDPAMLSRCLDEARTLLNDLAREIRTTSYLLHPPLLDECGLASAIRWYADGLSKRSGLSIEVTVPENLGRLPIELETTAFRIVQESLSNIHRHSGSPAARIFIDRQGDIVSLRVEDDGEGFPANVLNDGRASRFGVGLMGMRERVHHLNGDMKIDSSSSGTKILIAFPAPAARNSGLDEIVSTASVQSAGAAALTSQSLPDSTGAAGRGQQSNPCE